MCEENEETTGTDLILSNLIWGSVGRLWSELDFLRRMVLRTCLIILAVDNCNKNSLCCS